MKARDIKTWGLLWALCLPASALGQASQPGSAESTQTGPRNESGEADPVAIDDLSDLSLEELLSIQIVQAASRREQSIHDSPSSVTQITRAEIDQMGAVNAAELLRRVPGAHVARTTANGWSAALRNASTIVSNRTLVLLDGRMVQDSSYFFPPYMWMPAFPSELETVEVVRGPGSTLYGANAQGGVISYTSRRPIDHPGWEGSMSSGLTYLPEGVGAEGTDSGSQSNLAGYGHVAYNHVNEKQTLGARVSFAVGLTPEWEQLTERTVPPRFLAEASGQSHYHGTLQLDYRPDKHTKGLLSVSQSRTEAGTASAGFDRGQFVEADEQAATLSLSREAMLDGRVNTRFIGDVVRTGVSKEQSLRYHGLVLSDLLLWDQRNVFTLGGEISYADLDLTGATANNLVYSLIVQNDLALLESRALLLSAAARFETMDYDDSAGSQVKYHNANPRLSIIGKLGDDHDIRLTAASSNRMPSPLEVTAGLQILAEGDDTPARFLVANPSLKAEKTNSIELGWRGDLVERLRMEVVAYLQQIEDPVEYAATDGLPLVYTNGETVNQMGTEASATLALASTSSVYANFAGRRTKRANSDSPVNDWPKYIFGVGTDNEFEHGVRVHADFTATLDYAVTASDAVEGTPVLSLVGAPVPNQFDLNVRLGKRIASDHVEVFVSGRNLVAFFRDREDLVQQRSLQTFPIGATALLGLQYYPD